MAKVAKEIHSVPKCCSPSWRVGGMAGQVSTVCVGEDAEDVYLDEYQCQRLREVQLSN